MKKNSRKRAVLKNWFLHWKCRIESIRNKPCKAII